MTQKATHVEFAEMIASVKNPILSTFTMTASEDWGEYKRGTQFVTVTYSRKRGKGTQKVATMTTFLGDNPAVEYHLHSA